MRIGIIEDNGMALLEKYHSVLQRGYNVFVVMVGPIPGFDSGVGEQLATYLTREQKKDFQEYAEDLGENIDISTISMLYLPKGLTGPVSTLLQQKVVVPAERYFCDGLEGRCFEVADELGKDKVFIYSRGQDIIERALREGYHVVEEGKLFELAEGAIVRDISD